MIKSDCPESVRIIFYVYCIVVPLTMLAFIYDLITDRWIIPSQSHTISIINMVIGLIMALGIYCRKRWIPDIIIFISILGIINILLHPIYLYIKTESHLVAATIVGTYLRIVLIGTQLYIFSRRNVRLYFKEKENVTIY